MKKLFLSIFMAALMAGSAFAHSPLKATMPADGETVSGNPDELHLVFGKPARVTKIMLIYHMGDATHEDKLELASKEFQTEHKFHPEFYGSGNYTIKWRALGKDGHALKGSYQFKVEAE